MLKEVMVAMVVPASAVAGKIAVADLMVGYTLISIITFDSVVCYIPSVNIIYASLSFSTGDVDY